MRNPIVLLLAFPVALLAQSSDDPIRRGELAWERGDYPAALREFERLLQGRESERHRAGIARVTGELHPAREITTDGRNVRLDRTGRWVAYERGGALALWTHLVPLRPAGGRADSVSGFGLAFSPVGDRIAYLQVAPDDSLRALLEEQRRQRQRGDVRGAMQLGSQVAPRMQRLTRLVVRDLAGGNARELPSDGGLIGAPVFSDDGERIFFFTRAPGATGTALAAFRPSDGSVSMVVPGDRPRADLVVVVGGRHLVYAIGRDAFSGGSARGFVVRDLASGAERAFDGTAVSVASDGTALAYLERGATATTVRLLTLGAAGDPVTLATTSNRVGAMAIAPDGGHVAYAAMPREDFEIHIVAADGKGERRLTREIQHDNRPMWLSPTRLLAMKGEPRHTRSYLYDVASGEPGRFFHNNTVRTIAPEYEWVSSRDGSSVAIVAERDGDTVSPQRGVYVVDLTREVTTSELLARVRSMLAAELALRAKGERIFAPIAAQVQARTAEVTKDRLYDYQRSLFAFDSKHVSRAGNARAVEYLRRTYASFGYEPVLQRFEPRPGQVTANVVAVLRGTVSPDVVYVVGSHFDSRAEGPGADDNTSGTAMLLETARVLARHPLPATVIFAAFTGEEAGLLGSREFVRRLVADSVRLAGVLNNDMMGWSNDQRLDNTIRYSNPGIRDVQHGAAVGFSRLITYDALYYKSTDAAAFYDVYGDIVGGIGSYPVLGNPHYHQPHDVLETINQELVEETTRANVASIMLLASAPGRVRGLRVARAAGGDAQATWIASPERDVSGYVVEWREGDGALQSRRVVRPSAALGALRVGTEVLVRAVNRRGMQSWDSARSRVQ